MRCNRILICSKTHRVIFIAGLYIFLFLIDKQANIWPYFFGQERGDYIETYRASHGNPAGSSPVGQHVTASHHLHADPVTVQCGRQHFCCAGEQRRFNRRFPGIPSAKYGTGRGCRIWSGCQCLHCPQPGRRKSAQRGPCRLYGDGLYHHSRRDLFAHWAAWQRTVPGDVHQ